MYVHNGDDCLTVKGGCEDVLIVDSYFASGHGASVGYVTDIGVKNVSQRAPHVDLLPCFADTSFNSLLAACVFAGDLSEYPAQRHNRCNADQGQGAVQICGRL